MTAKPCNFPDINAGTLPVLRVAFAAAGVLAAVVALAGCGGGGDDGPQVTAVSGELTKGGQPLEVSGREVGTGRVVVEFYQLKDDGSVSTDPFEAEVAPDGSFQVAGLKGRGIPPGKYKIAVRQWDPYPQTDRLNGAFSRDQTPLVRQVESGKPLVIDLDKPEG